VNRPDELLRRCATDQFGLFNWPQAEAAGLTRSGLARRRAAGAIDLVLPGVWLISGAPTSWEQTMVAALLHLGDNSAVSHRAAARRWKLNGFEDAPCEVSTSCRRANDHLATRQGGAVVVHRVNAELISHIQRSAIWSVTSMPRTLLDLAGVKHRRTPRALDQALRESKTTVPDMWKLYEGDWIRRRRGAAILRELLVERSPAEALSESDLEDLMVEVLRVGEFPPWRQQYPMTLSFGSIRIDFAYPEVKLAIECDSYMWHMDEEAFRRDRRRDAELQAMGWIVLRFTWRQIKFERSYVQAQIQRVLDLRGYPARRLL
jgi:very-short-patch-repair endonuclease